MGPTRVLLGVILLLLGGGVFAGAPAVPPALEPWRAWVLHGQEEALCPFLYSQHGQKFCAWPERLAVQVEPGAARFRQQWTVYIESDLLLPGDARNWPVDVLVDGRRLPVIAADGRPAVRVKPGTWKVEGRIPLPRRPEFLSVPPATGLLELEVDGRTVERPALDRNGRLWLGKREREAKPASGRDTQSLRVFRKLTDEIPLQLETRIHLEVSGTERELRSGRMLLEGFVPMALESPLPARIEADGSLRIQVRPGNWVVTLRARREGRAEKFSIAPSGPVWPDEEVWVFEARHNLRSVEVSGPPGIDPQQTGLPQEWKQFPAYLLNAESELVLSEQLRGDPAPAPDQLSLERRLWLDFTGEGYTIEDRISGVVNRDTRLRMQDGYQLGRVELNGMPEMVTRLEPGEPAGIELRQGPVNLFAVSRLPRNAMAGAAGWDADFNEAGARLQLPPGWSLFSAQGVDRAWPSWIARWNLWDIFLVLIIGAAFARLYSPGVGLLAFVAVGLGYQEPAAPVLIWLNLAAVLALLHLVPESRVRALLVFYRNLSFLALVILFLPFAVDQVREAIYPQLEKPWQVVNRAPQPEAQAPRRLRNEAADVGAAVMAPMEMTAKMRSQVMQDKLQAYQQEERVGRRYEPGALIQTGPGQPTWQWNEVHLNWGGPVTRGQEVKLLLVPPLVNRLLNFVTVILFLALGAVLALRAYRGERQPPAASGGGRVAGLALLCGLALLQAPPPAHADLPGPELLGELKQRLLEPPECLPACASISRVELQASGNAFRLRLEVHAAEQVAVPVPGGHPAWYPDSVSRLDPAGGSRGAPPLMRGNAGELYAVLGAGSHVLLVTGSLDGIDTLNLRFPLSPHNVRVVTEGWQAAGVHEGNLIGDAVVLNREVRKVVVEQQRGEELHPDPVPPFLQVERTLELGVEWRVRTVVRRLAPASGPVNARIPLLPGESVTTPGVRVENNAVLLSLAERQRAANWVSVLERTPRIELKAVETGTWVETWRLQADTRWNVRSEGLPPVKSTPGRAGHVPEWRPWPGETLLVTVRKPEAVPGPTMTIEGVSVTHRPGQRDAASELALRLRSSQGGDYVFQLPDGAELQKLVIDGLEQALPQRRDQVRIPLRPGEQQVAVHWRTPGELQLRTGTPRPELGRPLRNIDLELAMPPSRWLLFTGGPDIGPAVLYWGVLVVVALVAVALGRTRQTPLRGWHWLLLGVGMMTADTIAASIFVVAWFFLMARRRGMRADLRVEYFNLVQFGLALLSLVALGALAGSIPAGLLGQPDMQIVGNGSSGSLLRWYQDYSAARVPEGWVVSVPMWTYRLAMLAWSLWLAFALLTWIRWGWGCYSANGLWRKRLKVEADPREVSVEAKKHRPDSDAGEGDGEQRGD